MRLPGKTLRLPGQALIRPRIRFWGPKEPKGPYFPLSGAPLGPKGAPLWAWVAILGVCLGEE